MPCMGDDMGPVSSPSDIDAGKLLSAQVSLINQQMNEILALKQALQQTAQESVQLKRELKSTKDELAREKERFLRSLQSVLGMVPKLKGHEMGEFIAACWRADIAEFQISDALKLYEAAEKEAPIQVDTLAKQMAEVLKEKR